MNLDHAYDVCEEITHREARNFAYGIRLLPRDQRRAMSATYAMARRIDDIGDGDLPDSEKLRGLDGVLDCLQELNLTSPDPVVVALAHATWRFPIPIGAFAEIVEGCRADVTVHRYTTFDQLEHYCRCVAGSVEVRLRSCRQSSTLSRPRSLSASGRSPSPMSSMRRAIA